MRQALALVTVAVAAAACGGDTGQDDGLVVVATTSIWADVARQIVGGDGVVETMVPIGADAHDYQPSPRQVAALGEADLVIANGLGLEEGLANVLQTAEEDGANLLEVAPELDPLPFAGHGGEHEDEVDDGADEHGSLDPHVWFDPLRVGVAAGIIADRLAEIDESVDWASRAALYTATLEVTAAEMMRALETVPADMRKLVTNHQSLGYLADRYGFEIVGVVIPGGSTLADPSSAHLAELVGVIDSTGVPAIFAETSSPDAVAEAVAAEAGEEVLVVELFTESLGDPGSGAGTLTGMLLTDAERIADALS